MEVYIPRQGDIIAITFDPQSGHEQKGRRPALVVSKDLFNRSTWLGHCVSPNEHGTGVSLPRICSGKQQSDGVHHG